MATIEHSDLVFEKQLGRGAAALFKGRWKSRDMTVAIKTSDQETLTSESEVMKLVDHPNLLRFYGSVVQPPLFFIVTEYVEQGTLFDFLHQNEFNSDRNITWARQIAAGLKYLHFDIPDQVVIHGNLKSMNVLVAADNSAKICGYSSSKLRGQLPRISPHKTLETLRWMAPEVKENKPLSKQCDVYSYGIVVWELLTHKIPFEDVTDVLDLCKNLEARPPVPKDCSPALTDLLNKCWDSNPRLRPEFTEIVSNMKCLSQMIVTKELPSQLQTSPQGFGMETEQLEVPVQLPVPLPRSPKPVPRPRSPLPCKRATNKCSELATIKRSELDFGEQLGMGASATVYKGIWKTKHMTVAIKSLAQRFPNSELEVMKLVNHPNLLHFYGTVIEPPIFCIVTEYIEQGALFGYLHRNEFNSDRNLMWAKQIAAGMKYLHFDVPGREVIHRDLKSTNVLVAADNTVKICDFGSSKLRNQLPGMSVHTITKGVGTPRWMAPEVLENKPISKQCDVYSYGIVVWELLTHKIPFKDTLTDHELHKVVVMDKKRPPIPEHCSPPLANILRKCWHPNSTLRPEFTEIVTDMECLSEMIVTKAPTKLPAQLQTSSQSFVDVQELESSTEMGNKQQLSLPIWAISKEEVEMLDDELGKGAWGFVTKAKFRGEIVAAKRLHKALSEGNPDYLHKAIRRELDYVSKLRHPNLVFFLGAVIDGDIGELIILSELMDSSLRDLLEKSQLSRSQIKSFSIDTARALNYLHSCKPQPLIHRDVSSANVLLQHLGPDYWKAKLSDYGSLHSINLARTLAPGNAVYAAPEAMCLGGQQTCKMDVYSFGVLLIEMFSRQLPTPELRDGMLQEIKWQEMHLLIETCIQKSPTERPEMQQIIKSLEQIQEKLPVQQHPNNYVEMKWFVPSITRNEAVQQLVAEGKEGSFLVRTLSSEENKYALSLLHNNKVCHYRIQQNESTEFYIDDNINFRSLEELIEFYKQSKGGLCTKLCEHKRARRGTLTHQSSLTDEDWEIPEAELECSQAEIAKGSCGYVVTGVYKGRDVAVRVTKKDSLDETGLEFIEDAVTILKEFEDKNLVKFRGICHRENHLLIVTELMPRDSLDKYLKQHQQLLDRKDVLLDMATQICSALKFLEKKGIVHGDLAARNCLVGEMNIVKVADYSLSLYTSLRKPSRTVVSIRWAAPELIVQQPMFTTKSDVWSFGVVMWELWSGAQTPYLDLRNQEVKGKLLSGHRLKKPENCPNDVYTLMHECWNLDPQKRPSFEILLGRFCSFNVY